MPPLFEKNCLRIEFQEKEKWYYALLEEVDRLRSNYDFRLEPWLGTAHSVKVFNDEKFKFELMVDERIDVMIDRAIKRTLANKNFKGTTGQKGVAEREA